VEEKGEGRALISVNIYETFFSFGGCKFIRYLLSSLFSLLSPLKGTTPLNSPLQLQKV